MSDILLTNGEVFDKLDAHRLGLQHYAFSVFLFDRHNKLLIQKRAKNKYHSGGLWSNSCCSHFRNKNEFQNKDLAIKQRIAEELGITYTDELKFIDIFTYKTNVGAVIENEIDYIFTGLINEDINIYFNQDEVEDIKFLSIHDLLKDIKCNPNKYTEWFKKILSNKEILTKLYSPLM